MQVKTRVYETLSLKYRHYTMIMFVPLNVRKTVYFENYFKLFTGLLAKEIRQSYAEAVHKRTKCNIYSA